MLITKQLEHLAREATPKLKSLLKALDKAGTLLKSFDRDRVTKPYVDKLLDELALVRQVVDHDLNVRGASLETKSDKS